MKRNQQTGLIEGVNYQYKADQSIDWRKMIPSEFLYLKPDNKQALEKKYLKPFNEINVAEAEDKDLVILLGGIRYLLDLRGYYSIDSQVISSSLDYACVSCSIIFFALDGGVAQTYSDSACAHAQNTKGFAKNYLVEMATNRALCRCVRNYLNIGILSKEELGDGNEEVSPAVATNPISPVGCLSELLKRNNIPFESFVKKLKKENFEGVDNFKTINDIPPKTAYMLITRIETKLKEKAEAESKEKAIPT